MKADVRQKTNFFEIMGDCPTTRVIDFLIENDREGWTLVEMKNNANVGYSTLKLLIPKLLRYKIIIVKRIIGKSRLYTINKNNEIVKKLYILYTQINKTSNKVLLQTV